MARRALSIAQLQQQLAEKRTLLKELRGRRKKLLADLQATDSEMAALAGRSSKKRAPKPKVKAKRKPRGDQPPLRAVIRDVLKAAKGSLSIKEISKGAKAAGYKTKSKQFENIVGQIAYTSPEIKKVARGAFILKGAAAPKAAPAPAKKKPKRKKRTRAKVKAAKKS